MKERNTDQVLILLASFNRKHLIEETLKSICNQTYKNWICYITDDNSSDGTDTIIKDFITNDERFKFFKKTPNYKSGLSGTRNFGLDLAEDTQANYIQFFDDDDLMHPLKLESQIEPFHKDKNLAFTLCKFDKLIELEPNTWRKESPDFKWPKNISLGESILTGKLVMNSLGPIWRKDVIIKYRFDERLSYAEEWVLFSQIAFKLKPKYEIIDKYLFTYRKHRSSLTWGNDTVLKKRKSSSISNLILADYLFDNEIHTSGSIRYLAKNFLIGNYEEFYYRKLIDYVRSHRSQFSSTLLNGLKVARYFNLYHHKLIGGLLNRL